MYGLPFLITLLVCGYSFYGVYRFVSEWSATTNQNNHQQKQKNTTQNTEQNINIKNKLIGGHWHFNGLSWTCSEKIVTYDFFTNHWNQFLDVELDNNINIDRFQNEPDELEKLILSMLTIMPFAEQKNKDVIDKIFFYNDKNYRLRFITQQKQPESKQRIVLIQAMFQKDTEHWFLLELLPHTNQPHEINQQQTKNILPMPKDFVEICSRTNESGDFVFSLYNINADNTEDQLFTFWRNNGWKIERDSDFQKTLFPIVCSKNEKAIGVKSFVTNKKITSVLVFDLMLKPF